MLFKVAALLLFAGTVAARLAEGTYRITNVKSQSNVRVRFAGDELFVSSTKEIPAGPFELWDIRHAQDGGFTIDNVGLNIVKMVDTFAAVGAPNKWEPVVTDRNATVWAIESAGQGEFVVKILRYDLLWNVEPPVVPAGMVKLQPADGSDTKKWVFTKVTWPPEQLFMQN